MSNILDYFLSWTEKRAKIHAISDRIIQSYINVHLPITHKNRFVFDFLHFAKCFVKIHKFDIRKLVADRFPHLLLPEYLV